MTLTKREPVIRISKMTDATRSLRRKSNAEKSFMQTLLIRFLIAIVTLSSGAVFAQSTNSPYKILDILQKMGTGGTDYVYADSAARRVYVPRGDSTLVFNLDSHQYIGAITNLGGHGVAIDPVSRHGFNTSNPVGMFDTETLQKIKSIEVQSRPDGILFEPFTRRIYVFSHQAPGITVIDPKDGSVVGTVDVGGAMEQAQSDGQGRLYVDVEDENKVAVVDVKTLQVITKYSLGDLGTVPAGLGLDVQNHRLFVMCRSQYCVVLNADDGKILANLPIGGGTDGGGFNPATMEAFSSQRDGTLTLIKEVSPTNFVVEQTLATKPGCRTSTLDTQSNQIVLICTEPLPGAIPQSPGTNTPAGQPRRGGGPGNLDVLWVGR